MGLFYLGIISVFIIIFVLLVLSGIKFYMENGFYLPITSQFAIRRYVFPSDRSLCLKVAEDMKRICKDCLDGDLLPYPFFKGETTSLRKRVICFFYDRKNIAQGPVAFHAPFVVQYYNNTRIYHIGLVMVLPAYRRLGIQSLGAWNAILYFVFHGTNCITTEVAASSSYLSVMEKSQYDYYPDWRNPGKPPESWQVDIAKFMVGTYPHEMAISKMAKLDRSTLIVRGGNQKDGDGAYHFINTHESRKSKNLKKETFMESRLNYEEGDEQYCVGKPSILKAVKNILV